MSDLHETGASHIIGRPELKTTPWEPISEFERDMSMSLRRLDRAKRGYQLERGSLTETEQASYLAVQMMFKRDVETVIGIKEIARLTQVDELPGIGLFHDGIHVFVTVPSAQEYFSPREVIMPIEELDEEAQDALPPLSEETVIRGLEDADERVELKWYTYRHGPDDDSWENFQAANRDRDLRMIVVVKAKGQGELPEIGMGLSEDGEKVILDLPPTASRTVPLPINASIKALETLDPNVRNFLPAPPTPSQG